MNAIRTGGFPAAAARADLGIIASSQGSARAVPRPRRTVRRDKIRFDKILLMGGFFTRRGREGLSGSVVVFSVSCYPDLAWLVARFPG